MVIIMAKKSSKKWGKRIFVTILILAIVGAAAFFALRPKGVTADVISPVKGSIATYYTFSGSIEAKNREIVFADQALQIKEWLVKEGDQVKIDQIIYKPKNGSEKKAKIGGEVLKIYADVDKQVLPGEKLIEIVDYSNYILKVKVDEYDFSALKPGKKAQVKLNSLDKDVTGTVDEVSKEGIYMNGVTYFEATLSIPANNQIRVGMSAEARILNQEAKDVMNLPIETILFDATNKPYVNLLKDAIIQRVDIVLGITDGVNVEVKSGLSLNDKVIIKKANTLQNFGPGINGQ